MEFSIIDWLNVVECDWLFHLHFSSTLCHPDGWMDGWMGGWMDGWMGGWMDAFLLRLVRLMMRRMDFFLPSFFLVAGCWLKNIFVCFRLSSSSSSSSSSSTSFSFSSSDFHQILVNLGPILVFILI